MIICDIKKQLRDFELDLHIELGNETLVIVGLSGCGKSTTLRVLGGLVTPDQGRIQVGENTYFDRKLKINISPEDRGIGFLFQNYALFPHLTVQENVAYGLEARKVSKKEQRSRVADVLHSLSITHLSQSIPSELSGGEQQRVALARAIILKPKLLLLDEPLSALDVTTRSRVRSELKKTLSTLKIPTIIVTHDYEDAISLGERILVMDKGIIIQEGTAEDLLTKPQSSFVADFSGTNYFKAQVLETNGRFIHLELSDSKQVILSEHTLKGIGKGELHFMVYPWDIDVMNEREGLSANEMSGRTTNIIGGRILNILSYGNRARLELEGSLPLTIEITSTKLKEMELTEGEEIYVKINPCDIHLLQHESHAIV